MAHVEEHADLSAYDDPVLVEGLPGVGLVGKIAADHLIDNLEMDHVASCRCEGLPEVAIYDEGDHDVTPPVRVHGNPERDLLVLQSDVPVPPEASDEFAACVTGWFDSRDVFPLYQVGLAVEKSDVPAMYGVGTGDGATILTEHDVEAPMQMGMISGPTGALLAKSEEIDQDSVGLIVQANPQFPDPESARILLSEGISPIAGIEVDTDPLVEQAEEIAAARQELAQRMQQADEESTRAQPLGMYQ